MKLIVAAGDTRIEKVLEGDVVRIGRSSRNELTLKDPRVSRYHCRIVRREKGFRLEDGGSQNGTRVNGVRILNHFLRPGDRIQVGDTDIYFERISTPAARSETLDAGGKDALIRGLHRERSNLLRLQEVNRAINAEMNLQALLERIIDAVIELTHAERGFLITVKDGVLEFEAARNFREAEVDRPDLAISRSIANQVIQGARPVLVVNAREDDRFRSVQSIANMGLRSVLCVPLLRREEVMGAVYVDNRLDKGVFDDEDLTTLEAFADQAAIAIENARRMEELRTKNAALARARAELERMNQRLSRTVRFQATELDRARARLDAAGRRGAPPSFRGIVGCSKAMRELFSLLERVIDSEYPVLIQGESGTGKELVACAIHTASRRAERPFVVENCAALPDTLLESELFGHVRGAFTGAVSNRKGLLETADKGTLFLDEVGEMSTEMQKKLLRFLQEGEFRPVGGTNPVRVDVRILSASNADLHRLVKEGRFREDLFYRLNVLPIRLPSLRERREDIPLLIDHFLGLFCEENGVPRKEMDPLVVDRLCRYAWPGNVRELENVMRRLVTFSNDVITPDLLSGLEERVGEGEGEVTEAEGAGLVERVEYLEKREIQKALGEEGGNKSRAARRLGISRFTLQRKMEKYGLRYGRGGGVDREER